MNIPLTIRINAARDDLVAAVNRIMAEKELPCSIFSLVMESVLGYVKAEEERELEKLILDKKEGEDDVSSDQSSVSS